jgi:hypothetical protein
LLICLSSSLLNVIKLQITSSFRENIIVILNVHITVVSSYELFLNKYIIKDIGRHLYYNYLLLIVFACYRHHHPTLTCFFSFSIIYKCRLLKKRKRETQHIFITTSNLIMSIIDLSVCEHLNKNLCNYRTIIRVTLFNPSSHLYMRMRAYVYIYIYISFTINWSSSIHSVTRQVG